MYGGDNTTQASDIVVTLKIWKNKQIKEEISKNCRESETAWKQE